MKMKQILQDIICFAISFSVSALHYTEEKETGYSCLFNTVDGNEKMSGESEFDDYYDFVELSFVVEDYNYIGEQRYRLKPQLKIRPIKGKVLPQRYNEQLELELKYGILGDSPCGHCSSYQQGRSDPLIFVTIYSNANERDAFKKEIFYFNPFLEEAEEDGTITLNAFTQPGCVIDLDDIKKSKGIIVNGAWLRCNGHPELIWYKSDWLRTPRAGSFKIDATSYIERDIKEQEAIRLNKGLKQYKGNFKMYSPLTREELVGEATYYYRDAPNGERIYEDTFSFIYYEGQYSYIDYSGKSARYYRVSGNYRNNKQVGTWYFGGKENHVKITFNDEGIHDGPYEIQYNNVKKYSGVFTNGYLKELQSSTMWGYFNSAGKPTGTCMIYARKSPVGRVVFENGYCVNPYYFENSTGDKKDIPEWVIKMPRNERLSVYYILGEYLLRSTPKHYFSVKY
jgi:hypothetical protein